MAQESVEEDTRVHESAPLLGAVKRSWITTYTVRTLPLAFNHKLWLLDSY